MRPTSILFSLAALLLLAAAPAAAQFGTVVPPPARPASDTAGARLALEDSAERAARLDVRAWVDSASRALAVGGDTATVPADVDQPGTVQDSAAPAGPPPTDTTIRVEAPPPLGQSSAPPADSGMAAPDTASPLPLLALLG
ncbi:MAG TPA: hypothetical protein VFY16_05135, partial [Gemmatimonadaceae bacterium]|nr:hypothetical protein [Gemmatimonadaceae bacterium]